MNAKAFIDSNVIVYAFTPGDRRHGASVALLESGGVISVQVLNEFANVARRKLGRSWADIEQALEIIRACVEPPVPLTLGTHEAALKIVRTRQLSLYDALIVAAAAEAKCGTLYSEDMQDGQTIDGVTIRNPFAA